MFYMTMFGSNKFRRRFLSKSLQPLKVLELAFRTFRFIPDFIISRKHTALDSLDFCVTYTSKKCSTIMINNGISNCQTLHITNILQSCGFQASLDQIVAVLPWDDTRPGAACCSSCIVCTRPTRPWRPTRWRCCRRSFCCRWKGHANGYRGDWGSLAISNGGRRAERCWND